MKSARERAEDVLLARVNRTDAEALAFLEAAFKEHAHDQRACCAAMVADCYDKELGRVSNLVLVTPAPGEKTDDL